MYAWTCVIMGTEVRGQQQASIACSTYFLRQGLSLGLVFSDSATKLQGSSCLLIPELKLQVHATAFYMDAGDPNPALTLEWQG